MKRKALIQRFAGFLAWGVISGLAAIGLTAVQAGSPEMEERRQQAQRLERKAQELKAEGQHEKAKQVMMEVEEIRANLNKAEGRMPPGENGADLRRAELKRKLMDSLAELGELRATGKEGEAAVVKRRVQELEKELARLDGRPAKAKALKRDPMEPRPGVKRPRPDQPEIPEVQRRLHHLEIAIENLHAAGLHEPADKLSEQAQRLRQEWQSMRRPEFSGPGAPSGPGPDAIRAELEELRQAIRELRARVEDLNRQRP